MGTAAQNVAEVFTINKTKRMERSFEAQAAALGQHGREFTYGRAGLFDRLVNALNRLPRPTLALGTLGLFIYAMIDPVGFSARMVGLAHVPEPLWWLLGAIVSFYFGARELHYFRSPKGAEVPFQSRHSAWRADGGAPNAALDAWRETQRPD